MKHPEDHHQEICELVKDAISPSSRRGERDTEYRRRILSAARTLLETNDIESVTMHQIAKESGVGQGTLYRRYTHIGDVCSDLIKSTTTRFIDMLEEKYTKVDPVGPGLAQLSACIHDVIDFVDENVTLLSVISSMHADKRSFGRNIWRKRELMSTMQRTRKSHEAGTMRSPRVLSIGCILLWKAKVFLK